MSLSPPKKASTSIRASHIPSTAAKSPSPIRTSTAFAKTHEIPLDPKATYTISYLNGVNEHAIDTGSTFEEARMKIVLLTCELERVTTYNYTLVKENEVLRVQANKSEREKDLETKLAIVLAENEKLNQVIEDVYEAYMSQRDQGGANEEYEKKIAALYEDLDEWKGRYNVLSNQTNVVQLQNTLKEAKTQNSLLNDELTRKDKDLEAIRGRLRSLEESGSFASGAEVERLRKENEVLRNRVAKNEDIKAILADNDKLNELLLVKVTEVKELKARLEESGGRGGNGSHDISQDITRGPHKTVRSGNGPDGKGRDIAAKNDDNNNAALERLSVKLSEVLKENERLNNMVQGKAIEANMLSEESRRLIQQLDQKTREANELHVRMIDVHNHSGMINEYQEKLILVGSENERLNTLLANKLTEIENLKQRLLVAEASRADVAAYEDRIRGMVAENQRLGAQIRELMTELDAARVRLTASEAQTIQIDSLYSKITMISSENERLNNEVDKARVREAMAGELQSQVAYLSDERVKMQAALEDKNRETQRLQGECRNLRNELDHVHDNHVKVLESNVGELKRHNEHLKSAHAESRNKIGDLEQRMAQIHTLEAKVNYLNVETEKLHKDVVERENHIQLMTQGLNEKEREIEDLKRKLYTSENQRGMELEEQRFKLLGEQEKKITMLRGELEGEIRRLQGEKRAADERSVLITVEIESLQGEIRRIKGELEEWKRRYYELEHERGLNIQEIEELRGQFEKLKHMSVQIRELQQKFAAERASYETQILQLGQVIEEQERRNKMLVNENEKLLTLNSQRLSIIEELRLKAEDESHKLEVYELRNQLEQLKANTYDVKQLALEYSREKAQDKSKINELGQLLVTYQTEVQKLNEIIEMRRGDVEALTRQNEELRQMCERLNKQKLISGSGDKNVEMLQFRVVELEKARDEYQRLAEKNSVELTRKNRELVEKIQELDILKLKYEEALANYQALNNQLFSRLSTKLH